MKFLFVLLFCLGTYAVAHAQAPGTGEDPYKKPALWKKLRSNPNDSSLWVKYVGKRWSVMTRREKESIARWRQELYIQSIADKESIVGELEKEADVPVDPMDKDPFYNVPMPKVAPAAPRYTEADMKQLGMLEEMIMDERPDIATLKQNVFENFVILEDVLNEAFAELGVKYRYFAEVHADGKYSELRWIEEQETRLKQAKQAKVAQMRKQVRGN
ncbi:MAG: hypothetical protein MUC97_06160 [Bernardetiaceae bacterium]|jgi:hypothetical protein|nr:hypothetical protein [Bernardetiaceae bacterium]